MLSPYTDILRYNTVPWIVNCISPARYLKFIFL